jgi:hypothetical protein
MIKRSLSIAWICIVSLWWMCPAVARAQSAIPLANAGFEGPPRQTQGEGTSVSSWLAEGWVPWSILGDNVTNREVEYKLITLETGRTRDLESHVHSGNHAQQFFTNGGSHTAGFYQRVKVPANSMVTFTVWAQMQTGQDLIFVDGRYVFDLSETGGGNYAVQVGVDPTGAMPAHFGAPLPGTMAWSELLWDVSAWGTDEKGNPADLWVPLSVTVKAQGEWIAVYTRGECKYPTKYNSSFWDDASVTVSTPPTPTPVPATPTPVVPPTATRDPTPTATVTTAPTSTRSPTSTPTATPEPTSPPTETPTSTATPKPTSTPITLPTWTVVATAQPTATFIAAAPAQPAFWTARWFGLAATAVLIVAAMAVGLGVGGWLARR